MQVLWLRYLTEINERTREVPEELLSNPEINKALTELEESAFTEEQLAGYEHFWDGISVEKTIYNSAIRKGLAEGEAKGKAEGLAEGLAKGKAKLLLVAANMKKKGIDLASIIECTGLDEKTVNAL